MSYLLLTGVVPGDSIFIAINLIGRSQPLGRGVYRAAWGGGMGAGVIFQDIKIGLYRHQSQIQVVPLFIGSGVITGDTERLEHSRALAGVKEIIAAPRIHVPDTIWLINQRNVQIVPVHVLLVIPANPFPGSGVGIRRNLAASSSRRNRLTAALVIAPAAVELQRVFAIWSGSGLHGFCNPLTRSRTETDLFLDVFLQVGFILGNPPAPIRSGGGGGAESVILEKPGFVVGVIRFNLFNGTIAQVRRLHLLTPYQLVTVRII